MLRTRLAKRGEDQDSVWEMSFSSEVTSYGTAASNVSNFFNLLLATTKLLLGCDVKMCATSP